MPRQRDPFLLPRILVVSFGLLLIFLDQVVFSPWMRFFGGFFCIYAFAPTKVNPLLEWVHGWLPKAKGEKSQ